MYSKVRFDSMSESRCEKTLKLRVLQTEEKVLQDWYFILWGKKLVPWHRQRNINFKDTVANPMNQFLWTWLYSCYVNKAGNVMAKVRGSFFTKFTFVVTLHKYVENSLDESQNIDTIVKVYSWGHFFNLWTERKSQPKKPSYQITTGSFNCLLTSLLVFYFLNMKLVKSLNIWTFSEVTEWRLSQIFRARYSKSNVSFLQLEFNQDLTQYVTMN